MYRFSTLNAFVASIAESGCSEGMKSETPASKASATRTKTSRLNLPRRTCDTSVVRGTPASSASHIQVRPAKRCSIAFSNMRVEFPAPQRLTHEGPPRRADLERSPGE